MGGTNAGRVLGKPVGLAVIILDASKAMIVVLLTSYLCSVLHINQDLKYICALACVIGHCWPIFAGFKGGKAVSTAIGYFFAVYPLWALAVLLVFLIILKIFKYVSLSSVLASLTVLLCTPFMSISLTGKIVNLFIVLILVYRHIPNLKRIKNHTEPKIKWM